MIAKHMYMALVTALLGGVLAACGATAPAAPVPTMGSEGAAAGGMATRPAGEPGATPSAGAAPGVAARATTPASPTLVPAVRTAAAGDIARLSDEFDNARSLARWKALGEQAGLPTHLKRVEVQKTGGGLLYVEPYTSMWYEDYRGPLLYKEVAGDFVVTARVRVTGKKGRTPESSFSSAGLMVRAPHEGSPDAWRPGQEDWVYLTTGSGGAGGGEPEFDTKTTDDSISTYRTSPSRSGWIELRVARVGPLVAHAYRFEGGKWALLARYQRPDLPPVVQVGVCALADYAAAVTITPEEFNRRELQGPATNPDLIARVDYVRYARPAAPALLGPKLADGSATDAEVLSLLDD
jgi:regulation of enolase protein 1 (concanavalin A-like superfamily)